MYSSKKYSSSEGKKKGNSSKKYSSSEVKKKRNSSKKYSSSEGKKKGNSSKKYSSSEVKKKGNSSKKYTVSKGKKAGAAAGATSGATSGTTSGATSGTTSGATSGAAAEWKPNCWTELDNGEKIINSCGKAIANLIHGNPNGMTLPICNDYNDSKTGEKMPYFTREPDKTRHFMPKIYKECDTKMDLQTIITNLNKAKLCRSVRKQNSYKCFGSPDKGHLEQINKLTSLIDGCETIAKEKRLLDTTLQRGRYLAIRNKDYNELLGHHGLISKGNYGKIGGIGPMFVDVDDDNYRSDNINNECKVPTPDVVEAKGDAQRRTIQVTEEQDKAVSAIEKEAEKAKKAKAEEDAVAKAKLQEKMAKTRENSLRAHAAAVDREQATVAEDEEEEDEEEAEHNTLKYSRQYKIRNHGSVYPARHTRYKMSDLASFHKKGGI
jgi:hypothetical protein